MNSRKLATWLGLAGLLLGIGSCTVTLTSFVVPPVVTAGGVFEIQITGTFNASSTTEQGAAVLQLPNSVKVLDASNDLGDPITRDDPMVLALYQPEMGHYLAAFSGKMSSLVSPSGNATLRVRLRAPATGSVLFLKLSLAAQTGTSWQINQPAGISSFATITAEPFARLVAMAPDPWTGAAVYQDVSEGLPYGPGGLVPWPARTCTGLATGDIDRDGRDDLVTLSVSDGKPQVYLSRGRSQPWLRAVTGITSGALTSRRDVALGDFNRDGFLDIVTASGLTWLGSRNLNWTPATSVQPKLGDNMTGVAVGDVNHDGFDDLAFGGTVSRTLQVFLSDGQGGFTESSQGLPRAPANGGGFKLLLHDMNADGHLDLVWTANGGPGVWLGDGQGHWTEAQNTGFQALRTHWGVDAADVDGDGLADLVFGLLDSGTGPTFSSIGVYRNLGQARWKLLWAMNAQGSGGKYHDVAFADFDRDGRMDVLAGRGAGIEVWRNTDGFQFTQATYPDLPMGSGGTAESVAVGDFDGDTFPDIAVATPEYGVSAWLNERTGFSRFGRGHGGNLSSTPAMGSDGGTPRPGNGAFAWTLAQASPSRAALLVIGLSHRHVFGVPMLPLDLGPYGAPNCSLLVEPRVVLTAVTDGQGRARIRTPIPAVTTLLGTVVYGQWAVLDAAANPLGLAVSNGGAAKIGP